METAGTESPERINDGLLAIAVPIDRLKLDPRNARKHNDRNLEAIKYSLSTFGQQKPIVVKDDGTVIAGNGTFSAATALGWKRIAAVVFDGKGARAFALADNRTAELAEWDFEVLAGELKELDALGEEVGALGWEDYELAPMLTAEWTPPSAENGDHSNVRGHGIKLTDEQHEVFVRAAKKVRETNPKLPDGAVVELLAADFLAGS